jgi:hypothetical protein
MWKKNLPLVLSALLLLVAGGCVKEDLSKCPPENPPAFKFTYTDENGNNTAADRMKDMRFYVFDQTTGLLVDVIRVSPEDIAKGTFNTSNLKDGKYTFVAWAGSGPDFLKDGFKDGQATGTNPSGYPGAQIGVTTLGDFRLALDTNPSTTPGGQVTPKNPQFDTMYWANVPDVTIQNGRPVGDVPVNFTKVTSNLQIDLSGLENLPPGTTPRVFVTGKNGVILGNGTIDPNSPVVRYDPYSQSTTGNTLTSLIKTMRLDLSHASDMPVMLYVQDQTGRNLVQPINVIDTIRNMRDAQGNQPYQTQAAVDRTDVFKIGVAIQPSGPGDVGLNVHVTVNGFTPAPLL